MQKFLSVTFFSKSSSPMVTGPVSFPARYIVLSFVRCEMANFSGWEVTHTIPPKVALLFAIENS